MYVPAIMQFLFFLFQLDFYFSEELQKEDKHVLL